MKLQTPKRYFSMVLLVFLVMNPACTKQSDSILSVNEMNQGSDIATQSAEDAILPAMEIYSYFVLFPFTLNRDQPSPDGKRFRVKDEALDTFDEMRQLLRQTFSEEITSKLIGNGMYEDYGGFLYATGEGRTKDDSLKEVIYQTLEITDTKITYEVNLQYWDNAGDKPNTLYFIREQKEGKWVFTSFPYFW